MTIPIEITDALIKDVELHRNNPARLTRAAFDYLEAASEGQTVIADPSNPFVFAVEFSAMLASRAEMRNDVNLRKQYGVLATTQEDLYLHMTDRDYLNRFGSPSKATFALLISLDEIYKVAVATNTDGVRKLVIPRDTFITVEETVFTMTYPLEIRIMPHNGLQIVYDVSSKNPLKDLETNLPNWNIYSESGYEFLRVEIETLQLKPVRSVERLITAGAFKFEKLFADQYHFTRVYMVNSTGGWSEIKTTHTDQVYDPYTVTAVLEVTDNKVEVTIPPIYFSSNMVTDSIRIDVFTTKGPIDFNLLAYDTNSFNFTLLDYGNETESKYYTPIANISEKSLIGLGSTTGGSFGLTFEELRDRCIYDSLGNRSQPITSYNIISELENSGYKGVEIIDNVVKRTFVATKALPSPTAGSGSTGAGCIVGSFIANLAELAESSTVMDNGNRVTVLPTTLFENNNGVITVVPTATVDAIKVLTAEGIATNVNTHNYIYTPFHYVFDANNNRFDARVYYFERPQVITKTLEGENATAALQVTTGSWWFRRVDDGFELIISTRSGDGFKALDDARVIPQLSYKALSEAAFAHLNGVYIGTHETTNERLYSFSFLSTFDVDASDRLYINNFRMFDADTIRELATALTTDFYISYIVTNLTNNFNSSPMDATVAQYLLPSGLTNYTVVTKEKLTLEFGTALQGLWNKSRPISTNADYQTYETNVPYVYASNVYETNEDGTFVFTLDGDNKPVFTILHNAGDIKVDEYSNTVYRHHVGELIRDEYGRPIVKNPRKLNYKVDMFFVDGRYYFATNAKTIAYRDNIPKTVVDWVKSDIVTFKDKLIEETDLFFYPLTTIGQIQVITQDSDPITISAEQAFNVQLYVDQLVIDNIKLQKEMIATITFEIDKLLQNQTVSFLTLSARLKAVLGNGVYGASINGLGGALMLNTMTTKDNSQRAVLKKKIVVDSDGFLSVQVDISVDFVLHSIK